MWVPHARSGTSVPLQQCARYRHSTASTHHPCGVLCVSLCAAFPFQRSQSLSCQCSFPPELSRGNSAAMRAPAVHEGGLCVFLQTRAHTPISQARSLLAAASPAFLGACPANASACRTMKSQLCECLARGVHRLCELLGREHAGSMSKGNNASLPAQLVSQRFVEYIGHA